MLSPPSLSLAKIYSIMNTTTKSDLMNAKVMNIDVHEVQLKSNLVSYNIIDHHALIQAIGKPAACNSFRLKEENDFMWYLIDFWGEHLR